FAQRAFSTFDQNKNGIVDFREFVLLVSNFCTLTATTLAMFVFDLYDTKKTGMLSLEELEQMLGEIFSSHIKLDALVTSIHFELKVDLGNGICKKDFGSYCHLNMTVLNPVFHLQTFMRSVVLGARSWEAVADRRVQLSS
ncbi:hypothetical protein B484DRAFT_313658, partial [Ochromonadaceae sp. CCMP2298]